MCDFCKSPLDAYRISGRNKKFHLCPNCTVEKIYTNDFPKFDDALLTVTIDSFSGPLCIVMSPDEAIRFLGHQLMPDEWQRYVKLFGPLYELHDDFYTDDGVAWQPVNSQKYLQDMVALYNSSSSERLREIISNAGTSGILIDRDNFEYAKGVAPICSVSENKCFDAKKVVSPTDSWDSVCGDKNLFGLDLEQQFANTRNDEKEETV